MLCKKRQVWKSNEEWVNDGLLRSLIFSGDFHFCLFLLLLAYQRCIAGQTYQRILYLSSHTSALMGRRVSSAIKICVNAIKSIRRFTRESKGSVRRLLPRRSPLIVMMNTYCGRRGHFQRAADSLGFKARGSAVTTFSIYRSCSGWDPIRNDLALETLSITLWNGSGRKLRCE